MANVGAVKVQHVKTPVHKLISGSLSAGSFGKASYSELKISSQTFAFTVACHSVKQFSNVLTLLESTYVTLIV